MLQKARPFARVVARTLRSLLILMVLLLVKQNRFFVRARAS
jgi:hypothetical protein